MAEHGSTVSSSGAPPFSDAARNVALQRQWYGEPLGDRVRRLVVAYDCSQAQLADVLGISPPMLSQLVNGRRGKIGNPAVLARLLLLERRVLTPDVATGEPAALRRALDEVRGSTPTVGSGAEPAADEVVVPALRRLAATTELREAASVLAPRFPALAGLLSRAAAED